MPFAKSLFALLLVLSGTSAFAQQKIALVDVQKAIQSTSAGKKAKTELDSEVEKKKKSVQKLETDLKKIQEDLEKKRGLLSDEVLQKRQGEFQEEMLKYRELVGKSQADLQKRERDLSQPILEKMKRVISKVAKDKKFDIVIENSPMIWFSEGALDITNDVVKAFEAEK